MKHVCLQYLGVAVLLLSGFELAATDVKAPVAAPKSTKDKKYSKVLEKFLATLGKNVKTQVVENTTSYEVTVSHPDSGGAEMYRVDKRTGESKMVWHEHPQ